LLGLSVGVERGVDRDVLAREVVVCVELEGSEEVGEELKNCTELVEMVEADKELDEEVNEEEKGLVVEEEVTKVVELDFGGEIDALGEDEFGESELL
jgi:hypothetical protein